MTTEPKWLVEARRYVGQREIAGRRHNPLILRWWTLIRAPFTDDETPWCAGFVGGVLEAVGIRSSRSAAARSYREWGQPVTNGPAVGAIVVFSRGPVNGHVGFVVGKAPDGRLMVLGGNQGNAVSIKPFARARVLAFRWPSNAVLPERQGYASLPVLATSDPSSEDEA